jgi:sulfonate transport system ATP-binding protein
VENGDRQRRAGSEGNWRDAARQALAAVGLENRAGEWPAALSGGQKQRVALARALIHRPGLLLLDEPLGALDALTRLEMQDLIVSLWQEHGFTVLLVTHDVSEAVAMADRVLLIEEGKIGLDLTVDIPRPRRVGSARLAELEAEVLDRVMKRGARSYSELRLMPDALTPALSHREREGNFYYASALAIFSYRSPDRFSSPFSCSSAARISA